MRFAAGVGAVIALAAMAGAVVPVSADLIGGPMAIDMVPVFNAGNAADLTGYGSVSYAYYIGRTEISVAQYVQFLNAVAKSDPNNLFSAVPDDYLQILRSGAPGTYTYSAVSGKAGLPVARASWYDAARFVNWLQNGQPVGPQSASTTEDGAYDLTAPGAPARQPGADWALPTADEWYKAAYYDPSGGYWLYPTASNTPPTSEAPPGGTNSANYEDPSGYAVASPHWTNVGAYADSLSPYGTLDQGGNVGEWTEELSIGAYRTVRGGSWESGVSPLANTISGASNPTKNWNDVGFRIVFLPPQSEVPEPGTLALLAAGGLAVAAARRRRR